MGEPEPMRVLISLHQGGGSGAVNSTLHLALGLARAGVHVRFVCPPGSPVEAEARAGGLEVHPVPLEPRRRWTNARRLGELLAAHPVDLANPQSSRDREAFTLLALLGRLQVPLVLTRRSWPRTARLENWLAGRVAARVIAVTEPVAERLAADGIPPHKLRVVHNAVLLDRIDRPVTPAEVDEWRGRIGWEPSRRTIGIVGRPKHQGEVVAALAHVRTPVRLVLAGLDEAALAEPLRPLPERHAVVRLSFDPAVRPLYDLLEIALHSAHRDAMPQALLEAMALGKPVIASATEANRVLIREGADGLLVPVGDLHGWAGAIDRLLTDGGLAARLGESARRRVREEFGLERTVEGTLSVYEEAMRAEATFRVPRSALSGTATTRATRHAARSPGRPLLLAYDYPPLPGGIARALGEIARHGDMTAVAGRSAGDAELDARSGVRVIRAPVAAGRLRTARGLARWARAATRAARESGAEFVWAGNIKPAGYVARWLRARAGIPYGLIVHGLDLGLLQGQVRRSARKRLVARTIIGQAAGTVANSHHTAERFRALALELDLPRAAERVRVIPLGADPGRFTPAGPRHELGAGSWLLTVARLVPHKGIDTALAVLARLAPRYPALRYAVAGTGPDQERLAALAAALGVEGRVRFLGAMPEEDLASLYRAAELYLGLSREAGPEVEGFGLALVEAQACGVPVVAGQSGGVADAVREGVAGILVPPGDVAAIAEVIGALLEDPARRAALGAGGRQEVIGRLNWERVARDFAAAAAAFSAP